MKTSLGIAASVVSVTDLCRFSSPKAPVANFEVDLDLSDLTDDIIPQTPPRVKVCT